MYDDGQGVPYDVIKAYKRYSLAAMNGEKPTPMLPDVLAKQVAPAQIVEATSWRESGSRKANERRLPS